MSTAPTTTLPCPSCGAPYAAYNPGLVVFVCDHCSSVFYRNADGVRASGKRSMLTEGFSRLYNGATGSFHSKRFRVLGRIRYGYERGFWDEWFLQEADGTAIWLTEDQHELAVQQEVQLPAAQPFERHQPGSHLQARDTTFVVQEVGHAECVGLEGALPKNLELGETYPYVDATSLDGRYSLGLEFDAETPTAFLGRWLKHKELELDYEGTDW